MGVLPSLASVPELQERRHSLPAGADSTMRSGPTPQQRPEQQRSRPDDSAAAGAPFRCAKLLYSQGFRTPPELQEVGGKLRHVCASNDQSKVLRKASQVVHS